MVSRLDAFRFVLIALSGWMNTRQSLLIDYLTEENRVLRKQLAGKRLRFTDDQRRRLAAKAKGLGRKLLYELDTIVTPETLMAWHRRLIAQKYDGSKKRDPADLGKLMRSRLWSFVLRRKIAPGLIGASRAHSPIWAAMWAAERLPPSSRETGLRRRRSGNERPHGRNSWNSIGICSGGLLFDRSVDATGAAEVYGVIPDRAVDKEGGDRRHRTDRPRTVDEPDGAQRESSLVWWRAGRSSWRQITKTELTVGV
jgi:hypothetical protein